MADKPQAFAVRVSHGFWGMVSTYMMNTGIGLVLAFGALWHGGFVHWILAVLGIALGVFLIWRADPQRLRYRKWKRPSEDEE